MIINIERKEFYALDFAAGRRVRGAEAGGDKSGRGCAARQAQLASAAHRANYSNELSAGSWHQRYQAQAILRTVRCRRYMGACQAPAPILETCGLQLGCSYIRTTTLR